MLSSRQSHIHKFKELLWDKAHDLYRDMPWRRDTRPYYVLVSELMLQQTQVDRVIPKFEMFIASFPSEHELASASLSDVLRLWQGLGYNRRAKFLHESAKKIVMMGQFPEEEADLLDLPGVGKNTAGAILAYAYNKPSLFIETNVRAVYIHHFFTDQKLVDDTQIIELLEATIDREHPRKFYWSLMDYGSHLKRQGVAPNRSRHYKKQPPLNGSIREIRGQIIAELTKGESSHEKLRQSVESDHRLEPALLGLQRDGLVTIQGHRIHLTK